MLTKKLKRIAKQTRKSDCAVLLTMANYVGHVATWLELGDDERAEAVNFGAALANVDLSAVSAARQALDAAGPTASQPVESATEASDNRPPKKRKKSKREKKKGRHSEKDSTDVTASPAEQTSDSPVEPGGEETAEKETKRQKGKRKNRKSRAN